MRELFQRFFRPFDRNERILLLLTVAALLLDSATTIMMKHNSGLSHSYFEVSPVADMIQRNVTLGVFLYNFSWVLVILAFRVLRSVEFGLCILHITGNGMASLDNLGILLFRQPFIKSFLGLFGLGVEHVLLVVVLGYLSCYFLRLKGLGDSGGLLKAGFVTVFGMLFALVVQFGVMYIWIRHLYVFFW